VTVHRSTRDPTNAVEKSGVVLLERVGGTRTSRNTDVVFVFGPILKKESSGFTGNFSLQMRTSDDLLMGSDGYVEPNYFRYLPPLITCPTNLMHLQGAHRLQLAGATQATQGPMEARAYRACQESIRRRWDQPRAAAVQHNPTRLRGAQLRRAASATRATRGPMEGRTQRAWPESTRPQQDQLCATIVRQGRILHLQHQGPSRIRHASRAQQMLMHLRGAQRRELAGATQATRVSMEVRVQRARQESTRRQRDQPYAAHVTQARILQLSGRQTYRHASFVLQTPARLRRAQSALAMRDTRGLTEARAQRAQQESTRMRRDQMPTQHVPETRSQSKEAIHQKTTNA
jgi:hypothetical protein